METAISIFGIICFFGGVAVGIVAVENYKIWKEVRNLKRKQNGNT